MVWYARILSPPKVSYKELPGKIRHNFFRFHKSGLVVTCPITLTTDLSDAYYPYPATLRVQPFELRLDGWEFALADPIDLPWRGAHAGARVIKETLEFAIFTARGKIVNQTEGRSYEVNQITLRVTPIGQESHASLGHGTPEPEPARSDRNTVPEFVDVWTAPYTIHYHDDGDITFTRQEGLWLQRRLLFHGMWEPAPLPAHVDDQPEQYVLPGDPANLKVGEAYRVHDYQPEARLWEEEGETMARHVWDGGIALAAFLANTVRRDDGTPLSRLLYPSTSRFVHEGYSPRIWILELGAGVGTAGLALARLLQTQNTHLVLTDLPSAQAVLLDNIHLYQSDGRSGEHMHAAVERTVCDWAIVAADPAGETARLVRGAAKYRDEPQDRTPWGAPKPPVTQIFPLLPPSETIAETSFYREQHPPACPGWDCILVSDCTYNADELHLLVATLVAMTRKREGGFSGKQPLVVLARKPRHPSEDAFFPMMTDAGFVPVQHTRMPLPDRTKEWAGLPEEGVDVVVYQ